MAQRQFRTDDTSQWLQRFGNGSDGAVSPTTATDSTANTTFSATSGSTSATFGSGTGFANDNLILIHQSRNGGAGAGAWELNKIASGGGTTSVTLTYATVQAYDTTAQVYLLKQYTTVNIAGGNTISASNWDGSKGGIVAYLANQSITIAGSISANGAGYREGSGGVSNNGQTGEGTPGGQFESTSANGNGAGGGGYATDGGHVEGGNGGGGGNGASGSAGQGRNTGSGGSAGGSAGNAALTVMVFGGGGASGGRGWNDGTGAGSGARGAGIVILIAPQVTVTGTISVNGSTSSDNASRAAGGAGAGGSCLIKGQVVVLGSSLVTGTGGTGGTCFGSFGGKAGDGSVGRIHCDYSQSLSGTTNPTVDSSVDAILNDIPNEQNYTLLM